MYGKFMPYLDGRHKNGRVGYSQPFLIVSFSIIRNQVVEALLLEQMQILIDWAVLVGCIPMTTVVVIIPVVHIPRSIAVGIFFDLESCWVYSLAIQD